jgi:xylulokinase
MGGAIGIDAQWEPVTEWSNPLDSRYLPFTTRMLQDAGEEILRKSGSNAPYFGPKVLWWKEQFPDLYQRSAKFVFHAGFVAGKLADLTADDAFLDRTYLEMTGLADIPNGQWSTGLCDRFGIHMDKLPKIVESDTVIGQLCDTAAEACGLPSGVPLVAGAGDKPAGYLGAGIVEPGLLVEESSTFGAMSYCVDRYVPDVKYRTLENIPASIPKLYYPTTFLIGSGAAHSWFRDTFGIEEKREAAKAELSAFRVLDDKAAAVAPGSEGLLAIGMLGGRGYPSDPDVRGMWIGHSWNHKKEHFYRALLESFAYEYAYALRVMRETYPDIAPREVRVIGGGAASNLWNQIKCDVTGVPYVRLSGEDFAVRGCALLAGAGAGVIDDPRGAARKLLVPLKRYEPDRANHQEYQPYVKLYERLFDRLRPTFGELKALTRPSECDD